MEKVRAHLYGDPTPVTLKSGLRFLIADREVIETPSFCGKILIWWQNWQNSPKGPFALSNFIFQAENDVRGGGDPNFLIWLRESHIVMFFCHSLQTDIPGYRVVLITSQRPSISQVF